MRLICTDFDGTLYWQNGDPTVPGELLDYLQQAQRNGVCWAVCSGRELPGSIACYMLQLGSLLPDYIITAERALHHRRGNVYAPVSCWNGQCQQDHDEFFATAEETLRRIRSWVEASSVARWYGDQISPLNIIALSDAGAAQVQRFLDGQIRHEPHLGLGRNGRFFRLAYRKYSKGSAIAELARRTEVPREQVFAIGDDHNDLSMLDGTHAAMVAAPSNAIDEVKSVVRIAGGYVAQRPYGLGVLDSLRHFHG